MVWVLACTLPAPAGPDALTPMDQELVDAGFERLGLKHGVTIFQHGETSLVHLAGEGRFDVPPERVERAVLDYAGQRREMERIAASRTIDRGPGWKLVYQRIALPVVADRDYTMCVRWGRDESVRWVRYAVVAGAGPAPADELVRVEQHRGSWQLQPLDGGRATRVRYEDVTDMAGWIPEWLAQSRADDEVPELFAGIRRVIAAQGAGRADGGAAGR